MCGTVTVDLNRVNRLAPWQACVTCRLPNGVHQSRMAQAATSSEAVQAAWPLPCPTPHIRDFLRLFVAVPDEALAFRIEVPQDGWGGHD